MGAGVFDREHFAIDVAEQNLLLVYRDGFRISGFGQIGFNKDRFHISSHRLRALTFEILIHVVMEVTYADFLVAKVQTGKARRMHSILNARQIVRVLGQKFATASDGLKQQVVACDMELRLRAGDVCVGQAHQVVEVEEHAVGIRRVRTMPEQPGAATEDIECDVGKDAVVKIVDELRVVEF